MMHHARSPVAGHPECFVRTPKLDAGKTRIVSCYPGIHSGKRGVLWHSSRGAEVCGELWPA